MKALFLGALLALSMGLEAADSKDSAKSEPLWKMKGKSSLSLGWGNMGWLGYSYWLADRWALKGAMGGSYSESMGSSLNFSSFWETGEEVGLRFKAMELGDYGFLFAQFSLTADQIGQFVRQKTLGAVSVTHVEISSYQNSYGGQLALGGEIFWPGSKRFSLETNVSMDANWNFSENFVRNQIVPGAITQTDAVTRSSSIDTDFDSVVTAVNFYF